MARRAAGRTRRYLRWLALTLAHTTLATAGTPATLPRVASINLCADQLVLALADPAQIVTVSWLAADPAESVSAELAARYPLNYGTAEELLRFDPDIVVAGVYTNTFARTLLKRLGMIVVELEAESSIDDIETNLRIVAEALGRDEHGRAAIAALRAHEQAIAAARPATATTAVVVRPGGFTVGAGTLADELMKLAGLRNVAAEQGLDRWGSLSMEGLLRSSPELVVLTDYRSDEPSLANAVLAHPALKGLERTRRTTTVPARYWSCGLPASLDSAEMLERALAP